MNRIRLLPYAEELRKIAPAEVSRETRVCKYSALIRCKRKRSLNLEQDRIDIQEYHKEPEAS